VPDAATLAVITRYADQSALIRQRVVDYITRVWRALPAYRDADIERFVAAVVPVVEGGQFQVAALTDGYLAAVEAAVFGSPVRPVGVAAEQVSTLALRGTPAPEVFTRAGIDVWRALADGVDLQAAQERGLNRAVMTARTNLQLARTHATRTVLEAKGNVVGYRRTLTGSKSCALCVVASTQRYRKAQLMPIHPGCDCGVQPIYGTRDPGQVIDPERLDGIEEVLAERFGGDPRLSMSTGLRADRASRFDDARQLLVTHEHGELGPVLGVRGQHFTGPDDL